MKPLKERLPLIDAAIDLHKGKWPLIDRYEFLYLSDARSKTTRQEFEKRAKELGYINGYKYGVEYETNGEKPDLPDDLAIECFDGVEWWREGAYNFEEGEYGHLTTKELKFDMNVTQRFRIVDERYKPKEQDMNDWYKKGELPPVGTKCEYRKNPDELLVGEIFGHRSDSQGNLSAYINLNDGKNWDYSSQVDKFRPLRTETDKLVDSLESVLDEIFSSVRYLGEGNKLAAREIIEFLDGYREAKSYRKIKPMSRNDFFNHVVDKFGIDSVTSFEMFKAGCRFLDQGE